VPGNGGNPGNGAPTIVVLLTEFPLMVLALTEAVLIGVPRGVPTESAGAVYSMGTSSSGGQGPRSDAMQDDSWVAHIERLGAVPQGDDA